MCGAQLTARTSDCPSNCNGPWRLKRRRRVKHEPKSSLLRENSRRPLRSKRLRWSLPNHQLLCNCATSRCVSAFFKKIFCTTVGSVAFSNDYLVQRALCADSEHHFGREEFDHHFPTAHRFPDSVYEINRRRRFIPTRNPIGRTHSADKRKQHFSRATLTRYKNMCVDV